MPTALTQDEKVQSFMEATCVNKDTAERCLERAGGDIYVAVERFFQADEIYTKWDGSGKQSPEKVGEKRGREEEVPTQPVAKKAKGKKEAPNDDDDEGLPWENMETKYPGAECFNYDAIKSKLVQSNYQGPKDGSTWLWYLVGDMDVYPDDSKGGKTAAVHLTGDKFQAGWLKDPKEPVPWGVIKKRQHTMVDSIIHEAMNSYGKGRRGCQPGYRHRWNYADSQWTVKDNESVVKTLATSWDEEKEEDRWTINVHMQWESTHPIVEGKYLIVADQRAEKLNKNQYQTNMAGRRWYLGGIDASPEKIEAAKKSILKSLLPPGFKSKAKAVKQPEDIKPANVKDAPSVPLKRV
eukprot:TRINITY_DN1327_c0_g1_i1.p1 TRINITY_DN1327_c0_g1~~TRINITY_DN1327_c0_g1_i1.p1  ORF type:complete len:351 (+),score=109.75 TRINITY_DN1327_c0_g1_i1:54-1106(+)